jgi:hypothetical protein
MGSSDPLQKLREDLVDETETLRRLTESFIRRDLAEGFEDERARNASLRFIGASQARRLRLAAEIYELSVERLQPLDDLDIPDFLPDTF